MALPPASASALARICGSLKLVFSRFQSVVTCMNGFSFSWQTCGSALQGLANHGCVRACGYTGSAIAQARRDRTTVSRVTGASELQAEYGSLDLRSGEQASGYQRGARRRIEPRDRDVVAAK